MAQPDASRRPTRPAGGPARRHGADHGRRATRCCPTPTCSSSATASPRSAPALDVPEGTQEIDASGGIVMPGMIDTHRHMWQTAMRGYGADWTLTQYFVWYYLEHGKMFRPEDVARRQPARRHRVARRRRHHHRRLVARPADASSTPRPRSTRCRRCPGRFVLAYGNIQAGPWEWTADPAVRAFLDAAAPTTGTTCSASSWPSTSPATRPSRRRPPSRWPASSVCR